MLSGLQPVVASRRSATGAGKSALLSANPVHMNFNREDIIPLRDFKAHRGVLLNTEWIPTANSCMA